MLRKLRQQRSLALGMSLIEASIVLGIAGVIVGGIWAVMSGVRESSLASSLMQQTMLTVRNVRDYYGGRALPTGTLGETTPALFTATLRAAGVFPEDMCPANCVSGSVTTVYNVYGGDVRADIPSGAPFTTFRIEHNRVSKRGCVQLGMNITARSAELGLQRFQVSGSLPRITFPVASSTLDSDCASATNNTIRLTFSIRN
jgi:type II secretory pathway pseudopilin PulG